jgi:hypothetical protein
MLNPQPRKTINKPASQITNQTVNAIGYAGCHIAAPAAEPLTTTENELPGVFVCTMIPLLLIKEFAMARAISSDSARR